MSSIKLSPKHGLNPAIPLCFFCNEPKNEIVLPGRLPGDVEAPRNVVWNHVPCSTCEEHMGNGIIIISVRDGETGNNPYRTGGWAVVKDDAVSRLIGNAELLQQVLAKRVMFMENKTWEQIGLPPLPGSTNQTIKGE